jgi:hemoglobin
MTSHTKRSTLTMAAALLLAMLLPAPGCGRTETQLPSSGDPEANQRAEQRVGAADDKGNDSRTLYTRLGGDKGIEAIVEDMTTRVMADPRVNFERTDVRKNWVGAKYTPWNPTPDNIQHFKQHMVQFLTLAAGGPAEYSGREIAAVHKGMRITNNEFDAMVGDFKVSMDALHVGAREKKDLLAIVETTRKQVVEKP